jgi:DNA-binding CsgD family transcriptional regulator
MVLPVYASLRARYTIFLGWLGPAHARSDVRMAEGYDALTEREKETLRLILLGHDAKSMASQLDLSVHTVNERLRNARRKMDVTSSKEAARLLLEFEGAHPHSIVHKELWDAAQDRANHTDAASNAGMSPVRAIAGVFAMSVLIAALWLASSPSVPSGDVPAPTTTLAQDNEARSAAHEWLELLDAGDWEKTYDRTATSFRRDNTLQVWTAASLEAREPLGEVLSRVLTSDDVPPTPQGYRVMKFRTRFANRTGDAIETLSLVREDGGWRIAGIFIE